MARSAMRARCSGVSAIRARSPAMASASSMRYARPIASQRAASSVVFVIVGPASDPAAIRGKSASDAFQAIAAKGPIALRYLKEAVLKGLDMTLEQGLRLEADLYFLLHTTADRTEGIKAFLEKRPPKYRGK